MKSRSIRILTALCAKISNSASVSAMGISTIIHLQCFSQRHLFDTLRAISNDDPELGYCQGMSHAAATLILYFEEQVFSCFNGRLHLVP